MQAIRGKGSAGGARRGSVLATALVAVTIVAGLGAALIQVHVATSRRQAMAVDTRRALYVAEAGLSEAFFALSLGKTGNVGTEELPAAFGDGIYWVEAQDITHGQVRLDSVGLVGTGRFAVSAVLERRVNSVASLGVFGSEEVVVGAGSVLDGFDSEEDGRWEEVAGRGLGTTTNDGARVTSNGDVLVEGALGTETLVYGDITPGPLGTAVLGQDVLVTGSTAPGRRMAELPPIEVPDLPSAGHLVHSDTTPLVLGPGEVRFDSLRVRPGAAVRVVGPITLVVGDLYVESNAELAFDSSDGGILVHALRDFDLALGSHLSNLAAEPKSTALLISALPTVTTSGRTGSLGGLGGTTTTTPAVVNLLSSGEFHGLIYAPDVDLIVPRALRVFGALAGRRLELSPGSRVSFDEALASSGIGVSALPRLVSWRIVPLPAVAIVQRRVSPLKTLSEQGVVPTASGESHLEKHAQILYLPSDGSDARVYTGLLSDLVWSTVATVRSIGWIRPTDWNPADAGDVLYLPGINGLRLPRIPGVNAVVNL